MVEELFKDNYFKKLSYGLTDDKEDAKDLYQEWALVMLEKPESKIKRVIADGSLKEYASSTMYVIARFHNQRHRRFYALKNRKQYFDGIYSSERTLSDEALEALDMLDSLDGTSHERDKNRFVFEMFLKHGKDGKLATCRELAELLKDEYGIDLHFTTLQYRKKKHIESIKDEFKRFDSEY